MDQDISEPKKKNLPENIDSLALMLVPLYILTNKKVSHREKKTKNIL